jgi:hypothetical protein
MVRYAVPWWASDVVEPGSVEMIFSQAVLEHVDDLRGTYAAMASWSTPTGFLSHEIDFRSHGLARDWDDHWTIPDRQWRVIRGRRPYLINRAPLLKSGLLASPASSPSVAPQSCRIRGT